MRQFVAILKDSFREAVDGFVIYAMLILSALMILVLASLSFTPADPDQAFGVIVQRIQQGPTETVGSRRDSLGRYVLFRAENVRPAGAGYQLSFVAVPQKPGSRPAPPPRPGRPPEPPPDAPKADADKPVEPGTDAFRQVVALWAKEDAGDGRNKLPLSKIDEIKEDERKAVTPAQMEAFVRTQFAFFAGMEATARAADGPNGEYRFDVTTATGSAVRGWPHKVSLFFGAWTLPVPFGLGPTLYWIENQLVGGIGSVLALLISVVITAFFIPNMIRKGSIDLLISKPIGRSQLLIYKYIGGLTFILLVSAVTVGGVWVVVGLRSGIWDPALLLLVPVLTFTFAILYAVSTLAGVVTKSPIVAILTALGFAVFLYIVGQVKTVFDVFKSDPAMKQDLPDWSFTLVDTLNNVLPRYKDLDKLTTKLLSAGNLSAADLQERGLDVLAYPSWGEVVGVSLAFIAVMLALSCWRFSRRDY